MRSGLRVDRFYLNFSTMAKSGDAELWRRAHAAMDRITSGELPATRAQVERLRSLLDAHEAWIYADEELKRAAVALMYERHMYLSKLWFLERLGTQNGWNHDLLKQFKRIILEESDEFKIAEYAPRPA
jgi:hypothetical protein